MGSSGKGKAVLCALSFLALALRLLEGCYVLLQLGRIPLGGGSLGQGPPLQDRFQLLFEHVLLLVDRGHELDEVPPEPAHFRPEIGYLSPDLCDLLLQFLLIPASDRPSRPSGWLPRPSGR